MARIIKTLAILIFLAFVAVTPVKALMADVFEVSQQKAAPVRILKGEVYRQSFLSTTDSFGIVAVKFSNNNKINQDSLIFRIKEADEENWFYENQYKTDQFQNNQFFPFGFPKINGALNKRFVFEIESMAGIDEDSVSVFLTQDDIYQDGKLWKDSQEQENDLVFKLIKEEPAKKLISQDLKARFEQDRLFFSAWLAIVILTTILIIILGKNYRTKGKKEK